MKPIAFPASLARLLRPLAVDSLRRGVPLFAVGGCVRDWLLGRPVKDLDFTSEKDPRPVAQACLDRWGGRLEAFDRFGTLRLRGAGGFRLDFVRARAETYPAPAALPRVRPGALEEDLARRDFSINAMALPLRPGGWGELVDPLGGRADLERGRLRVLHERSFVDDPTRLWRAARFLCRFGFRLHPETDRLRGEAVVAGAALRLSRERLREELLRILEERDPGCALRRLRAWGLNALLHPRLAWPARWPEGPGAWERLGAMAMSMRGDSGARWLESLRLERPVSRALLEALRLGRGRASARTAPAELTIRVLGSCLGRLPRAALLPLRVDGRDLRDLGLEPGPRFRLLLESAARAQWRGEFSTRAQALRWLRSRAARGG